MTAQEKRKCLLDLLEAANKIARKELYAEFEIVTKFKTGNLQIQLYSARDSWANEVHDLSVSKKTISGKPVFKIRNAEDRNRSNPANQQLPQWVYFYEGNLNSVNPRLGQALIRLSWTPTT